jgi:large repetitive protein
MLIVSAVLFTFFLPKGETDAGILRDPTASITSTLADDHIGLGHSIVYDVTVQGTGVDQPLPTGTMTFQVQIGSGNWTSYDTEMLSVNGTNAVARSSAYVPMTVGPYHFRAIYSGDNNYAGWQSADGDEPLTVDRGQTVIPITAVLSKDAIYIGESLNNTVTVPGLGEGFPAPTGLIDFQVLVGSSQWTTYDTQALIVQGPNGSATSAGYMPMTVDSYAFRAVYLGDANYLAAHSDDGSEWLTIYVGLYSAQVTNTLSHSSIALGGAVCDTVTVHRIGPTFPIPTGSVDFQVRNGSGMWTTYDTQTLTNTGADGVATSISYAPTAVGTYGFRALYQGSDDFVAGQSDDGAAPLLVHSDLYRASVTEVLSHSAIVFGRNVTGSATVRGMGTGYPVPTGCVEFQVRVGSGAWTVYGTAVLSARGMSGVATSDRYTPSEAGAHCFRAAYLGDANYLAASGPDDVETLTVEKAVTYTETRLGVTTIEVGRSVRDNVTVFGVNGSSVLPSGSVNFQVRLNDSEWSIYDADVPLVNGTAISRWYKPLEASGDYKFQAVYVGDLNYNSSRSCPFSEPLNVLPARTVSSVSLGIGAIVSGQPFTVNLTVSGLGGAFPIPTGTVNFQVKLDGGEWAVFDADVTLVNGCATSAWYSISGPGSHTIQAVYSGDTNYGGSKASVTVTA